MRKLALNGDVPEELEQLMDEVILDCKEYWQCKGESCIKCELRCSKYYNCNTIQVCDLILRAYLIGKDKR